MGTRDSWRLWSQPGEASGPTAVVSLGLIRKSFSIRFKRDPGQGNVEEG